MDGLLYEDVARQIGAPLPVAQRELVLGHGGRTIRVTVLRRVIVCVDTDQLPERTALDPSYKFRKWRSAADLEPNVHANLVSDALRNLERTLGLRYIDA